MLSGDNMNHIVNLHSNMGEFIRTVFGIMKLNIVRFTFQYGWIYKIEAAKVMHNKPTNLHSNMGEFISNFFWVIIVVINRIYIPIWVNL